MPVDHHHFDPTRRAVTTAPTPGSIPIPVATLSTAEDALTWAATDFGHTVHNRPHAVLRPTTEDEIADLLRFATRHDLRVVAKAEGHSTAGQAQSLDGIVVDTRALDTVHALDGDRIIVGAGARWSQVLAAMLPHGLTPPVLTDYLETSVGGTLSVGGLGGATHRHGAQTDNVLALDVLTPDGDRHTCSPGDPLFDAVRAGRGRHGIILRATLPLVPARSHALVRKTTHTKLADFLATQREQIGGRFDYVEGQAKLDDTGHWTYVCETATWTDTSTDTPYGAFLDRLSPDVALLRELGHWDAPHPWLNLLLPDHQAEPFIAHALTQLTRADIGQAGVVLIYPIVTTRITTPNLRLPDTPIAFLFAILRSAPHATPEHLDRMTAHNRDLTRHAESLGGTAYLGELPRP
ncbi:hypothetical protein GCM10022243_13710 [Saccharothrix violaceirubra]|uniref:FAD/FMN-containing dehydrogenase n=1 Tax=Saccharothrix violaceirubra TaxID=413306 RepID=A0A7W7SZ27_9PSEU|nr:FAD-binding protein [Saccharothrix violaceirubra]MBB4963509.1 FAD/FMN-containing dehydrogenase [Saccharothrix violaceirubra]